MARERRNYTDEFKKKIVELYNSGKPRAELVREYELTPSALSSWINKYNNSGSFKAEDNRTPEENELIKLRKENQRLKMENDILKQAADYGTKINVILSNSYKYPISAMCKLLNISSSSLYYAKNKPAKKYNAEEEKLTQHIKEIFKNSRNNYGSRKIKVELKKKGIIASKRRIRRIMKENGLVSTYTVKQYKVHKQTCNNDKIDNKLKRNFNQEERMKVIVSDLTYVNVAGKWNYICLMLDLYNREIVGYTAGKHKDADLVRKAITTIKYDLNKIEIFHTDRGNEFKNNIIDEVLDTFKIDRSLSAKGCPYDNAVAEATYKIIKTEFAFNRIFNDFEESERELFDYVNW